MPCGLIRDVAQKTTILICEPNEIGMDSYFSCFIFLEKLYKSFLI